MSEVVFLSGNADAVEFCPNAGARDLLAAATYTLVDQEHRKGSVSLFQVIGSGGLELLDCIADVPGIFDIRWRPDEQGQRPLLALALSDGCVQIHSLEATCSSTGSTKWSSQAAAHLSVTSSMCLSLGWDPYGSCKQQQLVVSHSDGSASTLSLSDEEGLQLEQAWKGHDFEVWTASYDAWKPGVVYTGSDDSNFCGWDLRSGLETPVFRDSKSHQMGVCCVQSSHLCDNLVATGSYDDNLRLWDTRMMVRPVVKQVLGLGGGVWKVKWHPSDRSLLAAACMYNGFAILAVDVNTWGIRVAEEHKQHQSLAYGVDWSRETSELVATCSFYDNALHLWKTSAQVSEQVRC